MPVAIVFTLVACGEHSPENESSDANITTSTKKAQSSSADSQSKTSVIITAEIESTRSASNNIPDTIRSTTTIGKTISSSKPVLTTTNKPTSSNKPVSTTSNPTTSSPPVYVDVRIFSGTETISKETIDKDIYITSTGIVIFDNVTIIGDIYCYGQLTTKGACSAKDIYAYKYGSMFSCSAFDGTHGKISGSLSCDKMTITNEALDYAFNKWDKK